MKIPENANPYRAIVNGVEHAYEAGAETDVADGVAELINAADNFPPAAEEVQPPFAGGGGGGGVLVVHASKNEAGTVEVLDKTWQEIHDAAATSVVVLERDPDGTGEFFSYLSAAPHVTLSGKEGWNATFFTNGAAFSFKTTEGANAYPEMMYK